LNLVGSVGRYGAAAKKRLALIVAAEWFRAMSLCAIE